MTEAERPDRPPRQTDDERPKPPPSPMDILRDRRALVDTGLGPVLFITVNALAGLETAAIAAMAVSVVVALYRAVRREPLTNAIGGILGTGLAVFIALRTGSASGFFVPRAFQNAGLAIAFWGSIVVRRPLVGFIVAPIYHIPSGWYRDPRIRRPFAEGTAAFAIVFSVRTVVYTTLILADREGALAGAVVVLGWPAFLGALWFCYRYIPRRLKQFGIDPDELRGKHEH
jgi:hypothetical protein